MNIPNMFLFSSQIFQLLPSGQRENSPCMAIFNSYPEAMDGKQDDLSYEIFQLPSGNLAIAVENHHK